MSSATSIDRQAGSTGQNLDAVAGSTADVRRDGLKPWHFFLLASLLGATAAVLMARRTTPEHLVLLSLTIGAAGVCAAALYATLAPLVRRDGAGMSTPLNQRTRAALEREKMLVLRSIKELEFDRAMGKMSQADFDEMAGRLRARALSLMQQLENGLPEYRAAIERELAQRVERAPVSPAAPRCSCGTANDSDAAFCKRCGKRLTSA